MFVPQRLTLARERRGLNKSTLASRIGVTPQTIAKYERGASEPPAATVDRIAQVLNFPAAFFFAEFGDTVPLDAASFRKLSRMTKSQQDAALAAGTLCVSLNEWVEARFDLPKVDIPDFPSGLVTPDGAAAHVRAAWLLGNAPITHVLGTIEAHGVRVFALPDDHHEVDAFSFVMNGTPFICLGVHKTPERAVFDLAHELGHIVLHRDHEPRGRTEELEADAFASSFLMPEADVRAHAPRFPNFRDLVRIKKRWKVSAAAINYRLHSLGITSDWHYRRLCIEISRHGSDVELDSLPREHSYVWAQVLAALREDRITRADIAHDLLLYPGDLNLLLKGITVSVIEGGGDGTSSDGDRPNLRLA